MEGVAGADRDQAIRPAVESPSVSIDSHDDSSSASTPRASVAVPLDGLDDVQIDLESEHCVVETLP